MGLVNATPALLDALVCNGSEGGTETTAAESATQAARTAQIAEAAAETATTAEAAAAASASAATAAEAAAYAAASEGGGAAAAVAAAAVAARWLFPNDNPKLPSNPNAPQLDKPIINSFVYHDSTNQLAISWQPVNNASAYRVELLKDSNVSAFHNVAAGTLATMFSVGDLPDNGIM